MHIIEKDEAKATGLARYFTGQPCSNGHIAERYVCNRRCTVCQLAALRKNRDDNPDRTRELGEKHRGLMYLRHRERILLEQANFRRNNPEKYEEWRKKSYVNNKSKRIAYNMEYQRANPEKCREWRLKWLSQNPDLRNASRRRYQAQKLRAAPLWADQQAINEFYAIAAQLTAETGIPHHVDHVIPLKGKNVCGLHVEHNLQVMTWKENLSKANKYHG